MSKKLKETSHRVLPTVWQKKSGESGKFSSSEAARTVSVMEVSGKKEKRTREDFPLTRFLPAAEEIVGVEARQARRLVKEQTAFLREFGSLEGSVADWDRLRREHKIFTVTHRDTVYVPSFQFDEKGTPRPAVAKVIQILGKDTSDWGLALWFTSASGRLDGRRPVDLLSSHPEEVIQAAEQEAAELVF